MSELWSQTAKGLADLVRGREVSAEEVTRAHLARIAATDGRVRAFLFLRGERALDAARQVDARVARGEALPLAGVPVAIKDVMHVAGEPTTCGSRILEGYVAPYPATAVARLEAAGAVVLGKTNMDEFAMGSSTENSAYFPTANPWDLERVPGGSSGGSAAAVAASQTPLALGSDTGGSIRQPAALCGVVGMKPTYGRVSRYGLVAFASSLDQIGPFAHTVEDVALCAQALFGRDEHDSTSSAEPVPDFAAALRQGARGLRVGVPEGFIAQGLDPQVEALFRQSLDELRREGAVVVPIELPHAHHAIATYYLVATAEASSNLARYDGVRYGLRVDAPDLRRQYGDTRDQGFGAEVKRRIILGTFVLSSGYYDAYYRRAQQVRTLIRRDFERAFETCDVIATPTTPTPAFRFGEKTDDPLQMYLADVFTVPANLAGLPGISLPCGMAGSGGGAPSGSGDGIHSRRQPPVFGLPAGLQFVGRPFDEATLLRLGAAYQRVTAHHESRPAL